MNRQFSNVWNVVRYTLYAPIYIPIASVLNKGRNKSIQRLNIKQGEKVLIVGGGAGQDLDYIPSFAQVDFTDITPVMVRMAQKRAEKLDVFAHCQVMDGHHLAFSDETFDHVILHMIVAVIPEPTQLLNEVTRVLKKGGKLAIYDKFLPREGKPSNLRKFIGFFTHLMFSSINRDIYALVSNLKLQVLSDEKDLANGLFRRLLMIKVE